MVVGEPSITVGTTYGYGLSTPGQDRIWGICVECTKGEPFDPQIVLTPNQMYADFKMRLDGYFGVGGQALLVTRVTSGTPVAAVHTISDTQTTPEDLFTLTANEKGSYEIRITSGLNASGGSNLIITEAGLPDEYYMGITTVDEFVTRINNDSKIVTATKIGDGNGYLETIDDVVLGTGFTVGSDGTTISGSGKPDDLGELGSSDAVTAHRTGLAAYEYEDVIGVFTTSKYATVQDEYVDHAQAMCAANSNTWRYACIGAGTTENSKSNILSRTALLNDQHVLFVGQGLIDKDGNEYEPYDATVAITGKRSALTYGQSIWGGGSDKILGKSGTNFFTDVLPMISAETITTRNDIREYNEKGVITFKKSIDDVRIREGITTVQPSNAYAEDEEAVVSILIHAKKVIYDAVFEMLGKNILTSYKTDLEANISSALSVMKTDDQTIIDVAEDDIDAFTVQATIMPRSNMRNGYVTVDATICPVHCAREVPVQVVIL